jgi:DNA end-binding protein Ku
MPRAIWSGSIVFGLVNVPARIYSAVSEHKLQFHMVHEPDGSPIGYQKVCKAEEKPVPADEIVKAFEYEKGEWVYMSDEDFEAARVEGYRTIEISDFVPYDQIDPIYFAKTYYVGPQEGGERVYALLVQAMEQSSLAGIAKFVMRDRQYLGALRVRHGVITLEQLYFADEIRDTGSLKPEVGKVDKRELTMASQLIESYTTDWDPTRYEDTYRDALCAVIEQKRKGKDVHRAPEPEEDAPTDIMEALRRSLESRTSRPRGGSGSRNGGASPEGLESLTKGELEERAREADIPGRSKMSKDELVAALTDAA